MEVPLLYGIGLISLFLASAFFSIVKIVFYFSQELHLSQGEEKLRFYIGRIEDILKENDVFVATVSFGKTCSNVAFAILAYKSMAVWFPHLATVQKGWISLVSAILVLTVFSHFIPRAIARGFSKALIPVCMMVYTIISYPLYPFAVLLNGIKQLLLRLVGFNEKYAFLSEEEKQKMGETQNPEEALDEEEKEMIHNIFDLGDKNVEQIMVPRVNVKGLNIHSDYQTVLRTIRECGHSRIPVYTESIDIVTGVLYAKDIIGWAAENSPEQWDLSSLMKPALFVPVSKKIDDLLREFRNKHVHIAIVVDEYGGTAGIVTIEDILEEIVGEIHDEYDVEEIPVIRIAPNRYQVNAHLELEEVEEKLGVQLASEDAEYNTIGGLVYHEYEDIPKEQTQITHDGVIIKVLKMDNQRIEKVEIEIIESTGE